MRATGASWMRLMPSIRRRGICRRLVGGMLRGKLGVRSLLLWWLLVDFSVHSLHISFVCFILERVYLCI